MCIRDSCSALPLLQKFPNLIIVRTFSKSFSLAGLRVGLLFTHPDIVRGVLKIKDSYNVGILSQAGGAAVSYTHLDVYKRQG